MQSSSIRLLITALGVLRRGEAMVGFHYQWRHWQRQREGPHHYAASLNSIPIFDHALREPNDAWLWRLAACAGGGTLTNIRPKDGSASMGWHGDPDLLKRDTMSADFGAGFLLRALEELWLVSTCTPQVGWLCLNCDLTSVRPQSALNIANACVYRRQGDARRAEG